MDRLQNATRACNMHALKPPRASWWLMSCAIFLAFFMIGERAHSEEIKRTIISISNPQQFKFEETRIRTRLVAETPLNHIGLNVLHHDWSKDRAPDADLTDEARGALVWFYGSYIDEPEAFLNWAIDFMEDGKYIVLLGDPVFLRDKVSTPVDAALVERFFELLGLTYKDKLLDDFNALKPVVLDRNIAEFERKLPMVLDNAAQYNLTGNGGEPFIRIADHTGATSDVVARTSGGGVAIGEYAYKFYGNAQIGFWHIDPFKFFASAFRVSSMPAPDVTTLVGRRIYFSSVDGDGWNSISSVPDENGVLRIAAYIMLDELIRPYPGLPVTVGPVTGDLDPNMYGGRAARRAAREIFALPNVELATHTHTHPFDWSYYRPSNYDPEAEAEVFKNQTGAQSILEEAATRATLPSEGGEDALAETSFKKAGYDLPRAYYDGPFDTDREIRTSVEITESLAPPGKKVKAILWPGDTTPYYEVLKTVSDMGLVNINGGATRFDDAFPSISHVSPTTRRVGDQVQVFTSMVSEAFYTKYWTSRYYGFRDLKDTIARTESPIRLRPIHIYYHTYSADRPAALDAAKSNIEYAQTQEITPVTASHYANIVMDAITAKISQTKQGWRISNRGRLDTLRFDDFDGEYVDYSRSVGVLGHREYQGVRYIALDPAVETIELAVSRTPQTADRPYLIDSRWPVEDFSSDTEFARFRIKGFGADDTMRWKFPTPCTGEAIIMHGDGETEKGQIVSDPEGVVKVTLGQAPIEGARVTLSCAPVRG